MGTKGLEQKTAYAADRDKFKQVYLEDLRCPKPVARFRRWIIHDPYQMPKRFRSLLGKLICRILLNPSLGFG